MPQNSAFTADQGGDQLYAVSSSGGLCSGYVMPLRRSGAKSEEFKKL